MSDQTTEILSEAKGARQTSERLLPLLKLLEDESEETSPLDELKGLLRAILEVLSHHQKILQRIESACATVPLRGH